MSNTKQLLPEQIGCISLKWLEDKMDKLKEIHNASDDESDKNYYLTKYSVYDLIKSQLFPLTDILEDTYKNGRNDKLLEDWCGDNMQQYLSQPITIKPKTCLNPKCKNELNNHVILGYCSTDCSKEC